MAKPVLRYQRVDLIPTMSHRTGKHEDEVTPVRCIFNQLYQLRRTHARIGKRAEFRYPTGLFGFRCVEDIWENVLDIRSFSI